MVIKLSDRSPQGDSCACQGESAKAHSAEYHAAKPTRTRMLPRFLGQSSFSQWSSVESHSATVLGRRSLGQAYSAKVTRPGPLVLGHAYSAKVTSSSFGPGCLGGPFSVGQAYSAKITRSSQSHSAKVTRPRTSSFGHQAVLGQDDSVSSIILGQADSDSAVHSAMTLGLGL